MRVGSYLLFYGLIKYKIETSIEDSLIENIIYQLTNDLDFLSKFLDSKVDQTFEKENYSRRFYNELQNQF